MKFLTLTQGDPIGLDLLKRLVEARYGASPPAMRALRVTYEGRTEAKFGPFTVPAKVEAVATYEFPDKMKWQFRVRLLYIFTSNFTTSFDGTTVYEFERAKAQRETDPELVESARQRMWAESCYFISPLLVEHGAKVTGVDQRTFQASAPGYPEVMVTVHLKDDDSLASIDVERLDPHDRQRKLQRIVPEGELTSIDGVILPATMGRYWGDHRFMALSPVKVELNPELAADEFVLGDVDLLAGLHADDDEAVESTQDEAAEEHETA